MWINELVETWLVIKTHKEDVAIFAMLDIGSNGKWTNLGSL